jgi:hypothetical protein
MNALLSLCRCPSVRAFGYRAVAHFGNTTILCALNPWRFCMRDVADYPTGNLDLDLPTSKPTTVTAIVSRLHFPVVKPQPAILSATHSFTNENRSSKFG